MVRLVTISLRYMQIPCLVRKSYQPAILLSSIFILPLASAYLQFLWIPTGRGTGNSTALWICSPQRFGIQVTIRAHNVLIGLMLPHSVEEFVWSHHSVDLF